MQCKNLEVRLLSHLNDGLNERACRSIHDFSLLINADLTSALCLHALVAVCVLSVDERVDLSNSLFFLCFLLSLTDPVICDEAACCSLMRRLLHFHQLCSHSMMTMTC
jgi:hypothetical protein